LIPGPSLLIGDGDSQGLLPPLTRAHADDLVDRAHPDLAVADAPGVGCGDDRLDDGARVDVLDQHLHADLRHEVDDVLRAPVDLAVAALAAESARLADGHARDPEGLQGLLHVVDAVWLEDCRDELHERTSEVLSAGAAGVGSGLKGPRNAVERGAPRPPKS